MADLGVKNTGKRGQEQLRNSIISLATKIALDDLENSEFNPNNPIQLELVREMCRVGVSQWGRNPHGLVNQLERNKKLRESGEIKRDPDIRPKAIYVNSIEHTNVNFEFQTGCLNVYYTYTSEFETVLKQRYLSEEQIAATLIDKVFTTNINDMLGRIKDDSTPESRDNIVRVVKEERELQEVAKESIKSIDEFVQFLAIVRGKQLKKRSSIEASALRVATLHKMLAISSHPESIEGMLTKAIEDSKNKEVDDLMLSDVREVVFHYRDSKMDKLLAEVIPASEDKLRSAMQRSIAKTLNHVFDIDVIDEELSRYAKTIKRMANGEKLEVFLIPSIGPSAELSGQIVDACWAGMNQVIDPKRPHIRPILFAVGKDLAQASDIDGLLTDEEAGFVINRSSNLKFEGGCVLIFGKDEKTGEPTVVIRGNNPLETFISREVDAEDFVNQVLEYAHEIIERKGGHTVDVPYDNVSASSTNRRGVWVVYESHHQKGAKKVKLTGDLTFNGYHIDDKCIRVID